MTTKRQRENLPDDDIQMSNEQKRAKKIPYLLESEFYQLIDWDGVATNIQAKCTQCKKHVKGQYTSTGNFIKHYK